ncbi:Sec-independent protein translocase protein TatB [Thermithiobacillus plumbiphilus]|uniref:Sec-independent protein translocase protein TatB n=1 Tax=Thermithiobacillus plumbiphilus TaxID=1729899 RepID=A0ABU9D884_9PROT
MFNIGFSEMMVIGIIALIVVGPDKLPELARTVGKWVGAARRIFADVRAEVDQQVMMDDIIKHNRAIMEMDAIPPEKKPEHDPAGKAQAPEDGPVQDASTGADDLEAERPAAVRQPTTKPAPDRIH